MQPQFLDDWRARAWSKFFCLSVYVTMYLNDHQRSAFYESLGLNTTQFNRHAIPPRRPGPLQHLPRIRILAANSLEGTPRRLTLPPILCTRTCCTPCEGITCGMRLLRVLWRH